MGRKPHHEGNSLFREASGMVGVAGKVRVLRVALVLGNRWRRVDVAHGLKNASRWAIRSVAKEMTVVPFGRCAKKRKGAGDLEKNNEKNENANENVNVEEQ